MEEKRETWQEKMDRQNKMIKEGRRAEVEAEWAENSKNREEGWERLVVDLIEDGFKNSRRWSEIRDDYGITDGYDMKAVDILKKHFDVVPITDYIIRGKKKVK